MQHIEKSAFRRGEYTALAGSAETLTRFRIFRRDTVWVAVPLIQGSQERDPAKSSLTCDTLRELDAELVIFTERHTEADAWAKANALRDLDAAEPRQYIVLYLDTDANGDPLEDSAGNPIAAGWYRYVWPLGQEPDAGPFETELDAGDGIPL